MEASMMGRWWVGWVLAVLPMGCGGPLSSPDPRGVYSTYLARPNALDKPVAVGCFSDPAKLVLDKLDLKANTATGNWSPCGTLLYAEANLLPDSVELLLDGGNVLMRVISTYSIATGYIAGPLEGGSLPEPFWLVARRQGGRQGKAGPDEPPTKVP